jgi:inorganic pyrophosphatase
MHPASLLDLNPYVKNSTTVQVIVETPQGSRSKFTRDPDRGVFFLKKMLPVGAVFPFDFGFLPGTLAEDGDPLDILLLKSEPAFPGCLVESRLVGAIEANQTKEGRTVRNDRLVAIAVMDPRFEAVNSLGDLGKELLDQIEHFFVSYNESEGKKFTVLRRKSATAAHTLVKRGARRFQNSRTSKRV